MNFTRKTIVSHATRLNWIINYEQHIVVVTQKLFDELVKRGVSKDKILLNVNGVDVKAFDPTVLSQDRRCVREMYSLENKFVFGYIGAFYHWHGIDMLANIIPSLLEYSPDIHFLLIGDGVEKARFSQELESKGISSSRVTFTGVVPQSRGREFLAACDAFISPTQPNMPDGSFYGSPTKVFEYMSMGKPTIVSDIGQLSEVVAPAYIYRDCRREKEEGLNLVGVRVAHHDTQGFISAAQWVFENGDTLKQDIARNARKMVISKYTWDKHAEKILEFVQTKSKNDMRGSE